MTQYVLAVACVLTPLTTFGAPPPPSDDRGVGNAARVIAPMLPGLSGSFIPRDSNVTARFSMTRLRTSKLAREYFLPMIERALGEGRDGIGFDIVTDLDTIVFSTRDVGNVQSLFARLEGRFDSDRVISLLTSLSIDETMHAGHRIYTLPLDLGDFEAEQLLRFRIPKGPVHCSLINSSLLLIAIGKQQRLLDALSNVQSAESTLLDGGSESGHETDTSVVFEAAVSPAARMVNESGIDFDASTFREIGFTVRLGRGMFVELYSRGKTLRDAVETEKHLRNTVAQLKIVAQRFAGSHRGGLIVEAAEYTNVARDGTNVSLQIVLPECWVHAVDNAGVVQYLDANGSGTERSEAKRIFYHNILRDGSWEIAICNLSGYMRKRSVFNVRSQTTLTEHFDALGNPTLYQNGFATMLEPSGNSADIEPVRYYGVHGEPLELRIVVEETLPDSQAEQLGIQAGDQLTSFEGKPIENIETFISSRESQEGPKQLALTRDSQVITVSVQPGLIGARLKYKSSPSRDAEDYFTVAEQAWAEGDYEKARNYYSQTISLDSNHIAAHQRRGKLRQVNGDYEGALADYNTILDMRSDDAFTLNNRAWIRATCPNEKYRNGQLAIKDAKRACELDDWAPQTVDTLAAAFAEAGLFREAIRWQEKALREAEEDLQPGIRERLVLYLNETPYREK